MRRTLIKIATTIVVIKAFDIIFAEIVAELYLNEFNSLWGGVAQSVFGAKGNIGGFVRTEGKILAIAVY